MTVKPKITVADPDTELRWVSSLPGVISGEHSFVLTPADGLQNPTSMSVRGDTLYVASAAYSTLTDPNLLLAKLSHLSH